MTVTGGIVQRQEMFFWWLKYQKASIARAGDILSLPGISGASIAVSEIFGTE
jgi:hypothetical protein